MSSPSFLSMARKFSDQRDTQSLDKFLAVAWSLWHRHNKRIYENEWSHPSLTFEFALAFQQSFSTRKCQPSSTNQSFGKWSKLPANYLKLNVDCTLLFDQKQAEIGLVLCDSSASLCFAASIGISYIQDPERIELLALLLGLQFCLTWGISHLLVECDCLLMVNACNNNTLMGSHLGNVIEEIRRIQHRFQVCNIQHIPREHNYLALTFARHTWQVSDIVLWEVVLDFAQSTY